MSRSNAAKKRRNQAKNLKRRAMKSQSFLDPAFRSDRAPLWALECLDGSRLEILEYWDAKGWCFITFDDRVQPGTSQSPVVINGDTESVKACLSWISASPYIQTLPLHFVAGPSDSDARPLIETTVRIEYPDSGLL